MELGIGPLGSGTFGRIASRALRRLMTSSTWAVLRALGSFLMCLSRSSSGTSPLPSPMMMEVTGVP